MRKKVTIIVGLLLIVGVLIAGAAIYGNRNQFEYRDHLEDTLFTLDGKRYRLLEMTYYVARQEYRIEEQAKVYNPKDTNQYWAIHTNGQFVRLAGKEAALDAAVHDMLFWEMAVEEGISLSDEEEEYARNEASDFCYDLGEEQKERAGLDDELIYEMTRRAALAEKYQGILAKKNGQNFGAYDYSGKAYEKLLQEHELKIEEELWEKVPFGNVAFNHRFENEGK